MDNNRKHSPNDPQKQGAREGDYKNVETSVNNPSYFDDSYESKAEDEISEEKLKSEKEQTSEKKGRGINR
jgi:hypothetical protein